MQRASFARSRLLRPVKRRGCRGQAHARGDAVVRVDLHLIVAPSATRQTWPARREIVDCNVSLRTSAKTGTVPQMTQAASADW